MTTENQPGLDQVTLTRHGADTAVARLGTVRELYAEIYAEPPYWERPADVANFAARWPRRAALTALIASECGLTRTSSH